MAESELKFLMKDEDRAREELRVAQLVHENDPNEALNHCEAAYKFDPRNTENLEIMGLCQIKTGRFTEAVISFERLLQYKPHDPGILGNLAFAHLKLENHTEEALDRALESLKMDPHNQLSLEVAADCHVAKQDFQEALNKLKFLSRIQGLGSNDLARVSVKAAFCLFHLERFHEVMEICSILMNNGYTEARILALSRAAHESAKNSFIKHRKNMSFGERLYAFIFDRSITEFMLDSYKEMDALKAEMDFNKRRADESERIAKTDPLTDLPNKNCLNENYLPKFLESNDISVAVIDLDEFKKVNDTFGHAVGDMVLKAFAKVAKEHFRHGNNVFRYGGEEFVAFIFSDKETALKICEQFRADIESAVSLAIKGEGIDLNRSITASIGMVHFPAESSSFEEAFKRADAALYRAKHNGRNQVVPWSPDLETPIKPEPAQKGKKAAKEQKKPAGPGLVPEDPDNYSDVTDFSTMEP